MFAALIAFYFVTGPARMESHLVPARHRRRRGGAHARSPGAPSPRSPSTPTPCTCSATSSPAPSSAPRLHRRLGAGATALGIVASGALGNLLNAVWHHSVSGHDHASIGASTAVFGAVGLLAATQLVLDRPEKTHAQLDRLRRPDRRRPRPARRPRLRRRAHRSRRALLRPLRRLRPRPRRRASRCAGRASAIEHDTRYAVSAVTLGAGAPRGLGAGRARRRGDVDRALLLAARLPPLKGGPESPP
jgi:hypothetical protein